MPGEPQLMLLLEIVRVEPLAGRVGPLDGRRHPFSGWIGLAAAITECLDAIEPHPADRGPEAEL